MNRHALGLIALLLVVVGFITAFRGPEDGSAAGFAGGCVRVGLVLGALWLALPQLKAMFARVPRWLVGWFFKGKPADSATTSPPPPPVKVKRPRRRSSAP
jgi:hypothetical protein